MQTCIYSIREYGGDSSSAIINEINGCWIVVPVIQIQY